MDEPRIRVLLNAQLRYYNGGDEESNVPFVPGATVGDYVARVVEQHSIPTHEYYGYVLDGTMTGDESLVPGPGSTLELVPALSGG